MGGGIFTAGPRLRHASHTHVIRNAVAHGDRIRRGSLVQVRILRWLLPTMVALAAVAAVSFVGAWPRWVGGLLFAGVALTAVGHACVIRWLRPAGPEAAAELDRAAGLGGALISGYWFSSREGSDDDAENTQPGGGLLDVHLERTASQLAGVDWAEIYRRPPARGRWAVITVSAAAVALMSAFPVERPAATGGGIAGAERDTNTERLPSDLGPALVEGVRAMAEGRGLSDESLTAIGQALQLADRSSAARDDLERLLAAMPRDRQALAAWSQDQDLSAWQGDDAEDYAGYVSRASLQWAHDEAVSRAKADEAAAPTAERRQPPVNEPSPQAGRDLGRGDSRNPQPGEQPGAAEGQPLLAATRGPAESFSSLLFGAQAASESSSADSRDGTARRSAQLLSTLRTEVVHARVNTPEPELPRTGVRQATTGNEGVIPTGSGRAPETFEPGVVRQPPGLPDARKPLVRSYFSRGEEPSARRP